MTSRALFGNPDAEIDHDFAVKLQSKDPKTAVNQFCQRFCHRPITKDDVIYTVQKYPNGYQATVKLNCIEGQEFAGELAPTQKDAEKNASQQVLDFYTEQINTMRKPTQKKKKRPASQPPGETIFGAKLPKPGEDETPNPGLSAKSDLNAHVGKILRRVLDKNEVMYETQQVVGGYQATVRMPGLPDDWGQQIWAGQVSQKKQDAEQSAAGIALEALKADATLMNLYNAPPKPKNWSPIHKGRSRGIASATGQAGAPTGNVFGGMAYWAPRSDRDR